MARRFVCCALFCVLASLATAPLASAQSEPFITIINPPSVVANIGIPVEKARFKLNVSVANAPGRIPAYFCLPKPPAEIAIPMHLVFKPAGPPDIFGNQGDLGDDISDWITPGFIGVPLPVDQIGAYEMMVICAQAGIVPPCCFGVGTASTAYSVEPESYKTYIEEDAPMAWWRLGDLPKGSTTMADATGNHNGLYYNGPALDRDGAPNCNVEERATTGCNDGFIDGITSSVLNDTDRAAFFKPNSYGAVQDYPAPTTPYTIEAWVNPFEAKEQMIFQHGHGPALYMDEGAFKFRQTDTEVVQSSGDLPSAGDWFHVVGTWDGVSTAKLYVNGELVGTSNTASTPPSGHGSTLYLGNGHHAGGTTFHGTMDEVAYYDRELPADRIGFHYEIATYVQESDGFLNPLPIPGPEDIELHMDVTRPKVTVNVPTQNAVFNAGKIPPPDFDFSDASGLLLDLSGFDVVLCVPLPMLGTPGPHSFTVVCTDRGLNVKSVTRNYTVADFAAVVNNDNPIGYWRLGDAPTSQVMAGDAGSPDGEFKNDTDGGPTGISGDADSTRVMLGKGGYGYVNGIEHPKNEYSMEAWIKPDDSNDAMIMQHGRGGGLFIKNDKVVFRQTDKDVISTVNVSGLAPGFHQVVGTWDGVYARLYIDGEPAAPDVYAPTPPSGFSTFYVGYGEFGPWFRGEMDEVSYYGTALDANRVFEHFYADPPPGETTPPDISAPSPVDPINVAPSVDGPVVESTDPAPGSVPTPTQEKGPNAKVSIRGKAIVARKRGKLVVKLPLKVTCPAGAEAKCQARGNVTGRSGAAIAALLGTATKAIKPGATWTPTVKLGRRAVKTLREDGRLKAIALIAVQTPDGQHAAKSLSLTLKQPVAKRKRRG